VCPRSVFPLDCGCAPEYRARDPAIQIVQEWELRLCRELCRELCRQSSRQRPRTCGKVSQRVAPPAGWPDGTEHETRPSYSFSSSSSSSIVPIRGRDDHEGRWCPRGVFSVGRSSPEHRTPFWTRVTRRWLHDPLREHRVRHLHETGDVGAHYVIARIAIGLEQCRSNSCEWRS